jgi:aminoglycoside/choline kinase family phosphotransferase
LHRPRDYQESLYDPMNTAVAPSRLAPPIAAFLDHYGQSEAALVALPSDASPRSYIRLAGTQLLLMEDRTDPVGFAGFIRLSRHFNALGLSAPRVIGADPEAGLALIEDFGTATYGKLLEEGHNETELYELAIDALVHLHSAPTASDVTVPAYDMKTLLDEISIFSHWFVPAFAPNIEVSGFDVAFRTLWRTALAPIEDAPKALVLRDFHIDNLMLLEGRTGVAACGLLDFQDGVIGAAEYDLMSLLQDARRDLAAGLEQAMLSRYLAAIPASCGTADAIMRRYHVLAAQRHTRLVGLFPRLNKRDRKPGYLKFMPRVLRQMQTALVAADLTEISDFLDTTLPGWRDAVRQ